MIDLIHSTISDFSCSVYLLSLTMLAAAFSISFRRVFPLIFA